MIFNNSKDALNWMVNHPLEELYVDEYGNYVIWGPYSNVVEYWHYIGGEDEGYDAWDMDRMSIDEFIDQYDNIKLNTEY